MYKATISEFRYTAMPHERIILANRASHER